MNVHNLHNVNMSVAKTKRRMDLLVTFTFVRKKDTRIKRKNEQIRFI